MSRRRIVVDHGIGKMKVWRIAAERYRNPRRRHTLIIKNVAGLHNLNVRLNSMLAEHRTLFTGYPLLCSDSYV